MDVDGGRESGAARPHGALMVGSVPLADSESVFRDVAGGLGTHLRRIPDGETGVRTNWTQWQSPILEAVPQLEKDAEADPFFGTPRLQVRAGASIDDIVFRELGFSRTAIESYAVFSQLRDEGIIGRHVRFQVCIPTPLAVIHLGVIPRDQEAVEQVYEVRLLAELDEITEAIPAEDLAIQWDTAVEFALLEGLLESLMTDPESGVLSRLIRLGDRVPEGVQMGYHLCYGDAGHQHFKQPADAGKLVDVANGVSQGVNRPVDWIHMPVPRDRTDEEYFAPLRNLRLQHGTEFYLGLVHMTDGIEGTLARIGAAQAVVANFGVATECGLGRRDPSTIPALLQIHSSVADPL